jgi:hypothetical protein
MKMEEFGSIPLTNGSGSGNTSTYYVFLNVENCGRVFFTLYGALAR